MKISIITVVYNAESYIKGCIDSVLTQDYQNIEYIIIDGGSTDNTCAIIEPYLKKIHHFSSEKDRGMYDALNKGIAIATGELVGILNADDTLASKSVISKIAKFYTEVNTEGVYGNLNYVNANNPSHVIRKWVSKQFNINHIKQGWMPAHPTLYLKRALFAKYGNYSLDYGTAADYELMIRFLYRFQVKAHYLDQLFVKMRVGGMSNSSSKQRYLAFINDYKAAKINGIPFPLLTIIRKKLSKIAQFLSKN